MCLLVREWFAGWDPDHLVNTSPSPSDEEETNPSNDEEYVDRNSENIATVIPGPTCLA